MSGPLLSVVVAWQGGSAGPCLDALAAQRGLPAGAVELVLADGTGGPSEPLLRNPAPVVVARLDGAGGATQPRLQAAGIAHATASWVAFTETCCIASPDWAARLLEVARGSGAAAVGGAVEPAAGLHPTERALALCDYAAFLRPFDARDDHDLPGSNCAFRRDALPGRDELARDGFWKTLHCRRLAEAGERLVLDPRPLVYAGRRAGAGPFRRRWIHGRCWGAMRARRIGLARRALYAATAPALPALLTYRTAARLRRAGRLTPSTALLGPAVLALHAAWIAGEWAGNLSGPGGTCERL